MPTLPSDLTDEEREQVQAIVRELATEWQSRVVGFQHVIARKDFEIRHLRARLTESTQENEPHD